MITESIPNDGPDQNYVIREPMKNRKTKAVHIISGLSTGGAERALFNLLNGGLAEQYDSHVVSLGDEGSMAAPIRALGTNVSVLNIGAGRRFWSAIPRLRSIVSEIRPDLIQGWMYHGNLAASVTQKLARNQPALVWSIRHSLYDIALERRATQYVIRANRLLSRRPHVILYNSELARNQHESFGFASKRGLVIPNGIDVRRFKASASTASSVRSSLRIPESALVVGHVARLHPMKNHAGFLRAASEIADTCSNVHFVLSGRGITLQDNSLRELVPEQLRNRFHLLGERSDVGDLMSAMDVFCLSSSWGEGFPNVIGEAMASGIPCVATDVGDSAVVIGNTGVVVPPREENALAAGIESLLKMPLEERRTLGARARARIKANYALGAIVEQYAALYEELMTAKGAF